MMPFPSSESVAEHRTAWLWPEHRHRCTVSRKVRNFRLTGCHHSHRTRMGLDVDTRTFTAHTFFSSSQVLYPALAFCMNSISRRSLLKLAELHRFPNFQSGLPRVSSDSPSDPSSEISFGLAWRLAWRLGLETAFYKVS
jgi:hypothetical protein